MQLDPPVQALPSSQAWPSALGTARHLPVLASHVLATQALAPVQMTAAVGTHLPALQVSEPLQRSPSSGQSLAILQPPQVSVPGLHTPALVQASPWVQGLPSSHGPLNAALTQPELAEQLSCVHGLLSSQLNSVPLQVPNTH